MALYIAFEGGEGSGKSTQAALLADRLNGVLTREPGGTDLGTELRSLLLDSTRLSISPRAEALMMAADRAQHLHDVVLPALSNGVHVIADRSAYSSLAYQGGGRNLGVDAIREVNQWAIYGRWPDVVILLKLDRNAAMGRLDRNLDRFEQEDSWFHRRVIRVFDELAEADPDRWLVVDADGTVEEVADRLWRRLEPLVAGVATGVETSVATGTEPDR